MPFFVKVIAGVLAAVVISVAAIGLAASWLIDPNDYRDDIARQVESSTGRSFDIDGDLSLSVFPWIAVEVNQSRLSDDPAFSQQSMAEIRKLSIRLKLLPLLKREIQVGRIVVDGLSLKLAVNEEGASNWESLLGEQTAEDEEAATAQEPATNSGELPVTSVRIEGLTISDATVSYQDRQTDSEYRLEGFNLESGEVTLDKPFSLNGDAKVYVSEPESVLDLNWQGEIAMDLEQSRYQLDGFELNAMLTTEELDKPVSIQLDTDLQLDLEQESLVLSALTLRSDSLLLEGNASAGRWSGDGEVKAKLNVPTWDAKSWLRDLGVELPDMSDPDALSAVAMQMNVSGSLQQLAVSPLVIDLDDSRIDGSASVDLRQEVPAIEFSASINEVNLDRYMAAADDEDEATDDKDDQEAGASADINSTEVDLSALNSVNAKADVSIGRLQANRVVTEDVELKLRLNDGTLRLAPLSLNLYSGTLRMEATVADSPGGANIQFSNRLTALQLGPLTEALMEKPTLSGLGNVSFDLTSQGKTVGQLRQALNGKLSLDLADGAVYGFNVAKILRSAQARRSGDEAALAEAKQEQRTDFAAMSATAVINNGVLSNRDLSLMSPALRLSGEGLVDLFKETIDYRSIVGVVETAKGQAGESLEELKGLKVPLIISGTFSDPAIKVDMAGALKAAAEAKYGEKVKAEKEEAKAKIEDKKQELRDKAREKLNRFFTQ